MNFLVYIHWFISIRIYQMRNHSISVDQARYATSIVAKYLDTATVKTSTKFYKTTFPSNTIFIRSYASTSDEKIEKLTREFNIHFRACIGSFIYLLSTREDLIFAVHKLAQFLSKPGKVHFEGMVHLLRYIRYNKTLELKYCSNIDDAPLSNMLKQASNKTKNQFMAFCDSSLKDFPNTGRSAGAYIIFYQGGPTDHGTHVSGPVSQSSA